MLSVQQNKRRNLPIANRSRLASQQSLRSIATVGTKTCEPCGHDMRSSLKIALPVTPDMGNLSCKFERCMIFLFRVNFGNGTDGLRIDGRGDITRNAACYRKGPLNDVRLNDNRCE